MSSRSELDFGLARRIPNSQGTDTDGLELKERRESQVSGQ